MDDYIDSSLQDEKDLNNQYEEEQRQKRRTEPGSYWEDRTNQRDHPRESVLGSV